MAASNPTGEMQFWFDGLPFGGIQKIGNDMGEMQFWFDGLVAGFIFPPAAVGGSTVTDAPSNLHDPGFASDEGVFSF